MRGLRPPLSLPTPATDSDSKGDTAANNGNQASDVSTAWQYTTPVLGAVVVAVFGYVYAYQTDKVKKRCFGSASLVAAIASSALFDERCFVQLRWTIITVAMLLNIGWVSLLVEHFFESPTKVLAYALGGSLTTALLMLCGTVMLSSTEVGKVSFLNFIVAGFFVSAAGTAIYSAVQKQISSREISTNDHV
ncbi:uncharacterized protein AB675_148 [Cyphellophora attinorum]|uniref:Uncharacterized protein n=1 Tax=Cyphellophora attinorum TaxID=1664694 RepID=A0A0N1NX04_9EURO|nr:uncharacterized protein AB675_148 [Phialophora attinorum]KPI37712.1 hypothetical protein AB675_148 [Phialophora attinorum]